MSVTFDEQDDIQRTYRPEEEHGLIMGLIIKIGLAKTPRQAQFVMLGISVLCISLTVWIIFG